MKIKKINKTEIIFYVLLILVFAFLMILGTRFRDPISGDFGIAMLNFYAFAVVGGVCNLFIGIKTESLRKWFYPLLCAMISILIPILILGGAISLVLFSAVYAFVPSLIGFIIGVIIRKCMQ